MHASPALLFASSALAIVPLAGLMGKSTEMLAMRGQIGNDGETYWMEGVLLPVYGVLALAFFCLPAGAA